MYKPNSICSVRELQKSSHPLSVPHHVYFDVLGKEEYEIVAQKIVLRAQRAGSWVPVPIAAFVPPFNNRTEARNVLDVMCECGQVKQEEDGYRLTRRAVRQIAERYPAETR